MQERTASVMMLSLLLASILTGAWKIQSTNAVSPPKEASIVSKSIKTDVTFSPPQLVKGDGGDWLRMDDCSYITEAGEPMLPIRSVIFKLPDKSEVTHVAVSTYEVTLQGRYSILPTPPPLAVGSQSQHETVKDSAVYSSSNPFPNASWSSNEAYGIDPETNTRVTYLIIDVFPLRYVPSEQKVLQAQKASITVNYNEESGTPARTLDNIIITSSTLEPYAVQLAQWKNQTGTRSMVLDTTWICSNYRGVDTPEKIRNCIRDFVATSGIMYVTIFGDATQVPVRQVYVYNGEDNSTATDLYYAALNGTWDDNHDGLYADPRYDYPDCIPDIYVGRLPVNNAQDAQAVVNKIETYQQDFDPSQTWTSRVVLAAGTCSPDGYNDTDKNGTEVLNDYIANLTADTNITKLYEKAGNLSTNSMASQLDSGALFTNFAGHGDAGKWLFYWVFPPLDWHNGFGISDVKSLSNNYELPVVTTTACDAARFDDNDCIGKWFVCAPNGGAIAYFGGTRTTYSWRDERIPYSCIGEMDRRIYENYYASFTKLGQMWEQCILEYYANHIAPWSYKSAYSEDVLTLMEFVLLGDPTLRIYNGPETLKVPDDYTTIQGAINSAYNGDTIEIAPGEYHENIIVNKTVSILGEDRDKTILDSCGVYVTSQGATISNLTVRNYNYSCVSLLNTNFCNVSNNNFDSSSTGVMLSNSSYNQVWDNSITNCSYGISLSYAQGNSISGNNITNNSEGITFGSSSNNSIVGNNLIANNYGGIRLYGSSGNVIYHNNFMDNSEQAYSGSVNVWDSGYSSGGNYWSDYAGIDEKSAPNQDQPGSDGIGDTGYVIDSNNTDHYPLMHPWCSLPVHNMNTGLGYATIQGAINANETQAGHKIFVETGTYYENVVVNKTVSLTGEDLHFTTINGSLGGLFNSDISVTADDVQISGFHITFGGIGVYIYSADRTDVTNNLIDYNGGGIKIDSANQTAVMNNTIDNNGGSGIFLYWSFNDTIVGNTISNTTGTRSSAGFRAQYSNDSLIYHNNFIHNIWAPLAIVQSSNTWDDGYPTGGNYWGPWVYPSDVFKGPYQNETGSDGIIDGCFWQISGIVDNYPLAKPWPWGSHDLGLTCIDLDTSKTIIWLGSKVNVSVYIMNYGSNPEVFNVTTYANDTGIDTITDVTLASKNSTILDFTWDTTGFAWGNYTISVYASPVPGETDTTDNNFTGGSVVVSMVGDLTGGSTNVWDFVPDGKVDGKDIAVVAKCFGSAPGAQPPEIWNPNCDVNDDGKVDGKDIAIVARHFGEKDP